MRAMVFDHYGEPGVMELREVPVPEAQDGEVLIRVGYAVSIIRFENALGAEYDAYVARTWRLLPQNLLISRRARRAGASFAYCISEARPKSRSSNAPRDGDDASRTAREPAFCW